jgi:tetratricopeptide (TPR) repeat protein
MINKHANTVILVLVFLLLSGCTTKQMPETAPEQLAEYNKIIQEADAMYGRGCYVGLRQAYKLYEKAFKVPVLKEKATEKLLKTAILLGLRERELGILEETYLPKAKDIVATSSSFEDYSILLQAASAIPRNTIGVVGDSAEGRDRSPLSLEDVKADVEQWIELFMRKSAAEDVYAYVAIGFYPLFSSLIEEKLDIESIEQSFPDSPLIWYRMAQQPWGNPLVLEKLALDDPQFHEVHFVLGQKAMERRMLVTAERKFLKAYEELPQSSTLVISLASIYFAFEELDTSLEFYEKTLELAPYHRDALLGKAMCLSYIGRHEEAIDACNHIFALGKYYIGESHYWLAWNLNETGRWEEAWENIEAAKKHLTGNAEVSLLAGKIAFNQKRLEEAEKNLRESNKLDASNGDSFYYLGKIKNMQEDWLNAGAYFDSASSRYEIQENEILKKIEEIRDSEFSEERKKKHLSRKTSQLKMMQLTKATSWFNAAAGFYNAGYPKKALQLAEKAASHRALKEKAEELLNLVKK